MDVNEMRFVATTKKGKEVVGWVVQSRGRWFIFDEKTHQFESIVGPELIRLIKVKKEEKL